MKRIILLSVFGLILGVGSLLSQPAAAITSQPPSQALPATVAAVDYFAKCPKSFLGLVPWYNYMDKEFKFTKDSDSELAKCQIHCFNIFTQNVANDCGQTKSDIPGVLLAVIDDLLRIAGLVAVAFVFVGAFQYVESRGNSEKTAAAQSTIINALVGLVVAMVAVGLIAFLGNKLG